MDFDWLELEDEGASPERPERLRTPPTDGPSFLEAARSMRRAGFFKSAARYYARATGFEEHNYAAWAEYVDTLVRARQLDEADRLSAAILDKYRRVHVLYASRALILSHRNQTEEAMRHSDVSIEHGTGYYPRCVRAEILLRAKKGSREYRRDALALYEEILNRHEDSWEVHFLAACALMDAGWPAHAAGFFTEAIHHDPVGTTAWLGLGDCFHALRLYDQAVFCFDQAKNIEPTLRVRVGKRKRAAQLRYGLLSLFDRGALDRRWEKLYRIHHEKPWKPAHNDF